ncbi:MAG: type III secretion system export apparatus subunit SctV [Myxococcota bacterium]
MKVSTQQLAALPLRELSRRPDIVVAIFVTFIISMMMVPLPSFMIDALICVNIAISLTIMLVALFAKNALEVSSFPTLLLITTLFRLGLNISTTRGILAHAEAGQMVKAFGSLIIGGDFVVGVVIFCVITLVQFIVVAKGSERVAEVGARFTLDAMPGKQMSIDAAARSGSISEEEAQSRRDELNRASQLFGNMDGAMKFVKGDAIAGLIITALNIVAGVVIGILRHDMSAADALQLYSTLTIGDGIVAQIGSLLVTIAAGILVTRVEAKDKSKNFGFSLKDELLGNSKVLQIAGGAMGMLALVPGVPTLPVMMCSLSLTALGALSKFLPRLMGTQQTFATTLSNQQALKSKLEQKIQQAKAQKSICDNLAPSVLPICIELDPELSELLGFTDEGQNDQCELLSVYVPQLRDALYLDSGIRFPGVRVRSHMTSLSKYSFMIRIDEVPVVQEKIEPGMLLVPVAPERLQRLAIDVKPVEHPISKGTISLVSKDDRDVVEGLGMTLWTEAGTISLYLAAVLRKKAKDFIGLQEVSELMDSLEKAYPTLVREVIPKVVSLTQMVGILRRLVDEGVSIRNLKRIAETLGEYGARDHDVLFLTECVRASLSAQLAHAYAGSDNSLPVVLLDPVIEDTIQGSIETSAHGQVLTLSPEICREVITTIHEALQPVIAKGKKPIVLTTAAIRRFVRKLLETDLPQVTVLSFDELPAELMIQPMGRASLAAGE